MNNNDCYYLLEWDSPNVMRNRWELFKADQEWIEQKKKVQKIYGEIVTEINEQVLTSMHFQDSKSVLTNNGFPIFNIGNIKCIALSDGFVSLPTQPSIAPHISKEVVSKELEENFRNDSIINYPINILLLKVNERLILIDAGQGSFTNKNAGNLIGNLQSIGITPHQITDIIISHAHTDHIDGLIDEKKRSIYKNAMIHISRVEYEFWKSIDNDFGKVINNVLSQYCPK